MKQTIHFDILIFLHFLSIMNSINLENFVDELIDDFCCVRREYLKTEYIQEKLTDELKTLKEEAIGNGSTYPELYQFVKTSCFPVLFSILNPLNFKVKFDHQSEQKSEQNLIVVVVDFFIREIGLPISREQWLQEELENNKIEQQKKIEEKLRKMEEERMKEEKKLKEERIYKKIKKEKLQQLINHHTEKIVDEYLAIDKNFVDLNKLTRDIQIKYFKFLTSTDIMETVEEIFFQDDDEDVVYNNEIIYNKLRNFEKITSFIHDIKRDLFCCENFSYTKFKFFDNKSYPVEYLITECLYDYTLINTQKAQLLSQLNTHKE